VQILVFLGLSVLDLGPMYATERQTDVRQTDVRSASSLNAYAIWGRGIINHTNRIVSFPAQNKCSNTRTKTLE